MKKMALVLGGMMAMVAMSTGCSIIEQYQDDIQEKVVSALRDKGVDAASEKIDDLVAAGTLTATQGAALKEALPYGVDALETTFAVESVKAEEANAVNSAE